MFGCRKAKGRIAASIYEPLPERDRKALARHLARCAACRDEAESLARVAAAIPRTEPELNIDLLPILRRRLAEEATPRAYTWRIPALAAAALFLCVAGVTLYARHSTESPAQVAATHPSTPVQLALADANRLVTERNYGAAYTTLEKAVADHPTDAHAGEAQLRLADLAFSQLHMYDVADAAYLKLVSDYPDAVDPDTAAYEIALRRNLLEEGRADRYRALYALDAARRDPANALAKYEAVISRNPTAVVASQALEEMVALTSPQASTDPKTRMAAMETIRGQLKNPDAVAKLNIEMGHLAWHQLGDLMVARESFEKAATSTNSALAQRARESLDELSRTNP